jgi:tetratricopeptide (TPR) repeat protein
LFGPPRVVSLYGMNCFIARWFAGVLLAAVLAAGCRAPTAARLTEADELVRRTEAHARFAAGIVQELNDNLAAAWEEFYLAAKANPKDPDLLLDVSGRLIQARQFSRAVEVLTWATARPDADPVFFVRLGFVYAQIGETKKSLAANQTAVRRLPRYLPARHNLYLNHVQAKQPELALAVLDDAAVPKDLDAEYLINLAELYSNWGQQFPEQKERARLKAVRMLDRAAALQPKLPPQPLKLAEGFALLGETEKAAQWYLEILEHGAPSAPLRDILRAKLAEIFLRSADRGRAREQLVAIVREHPANAGAHYFLGAIAVEDQRWEDAITSFQMAISGDPNFEQAYYDLATTQLTAKRGAESIATLQAVRQRKPTSFVPEYLLGMAYHEQKKFAEAVAHLTTAETIARISETNRLNPAFYFQLGAAHERNGNRAEAAKYFERSIALAPDNADALNYLGYMWAEQGENLPRARELIERALKLEPENDAFLDSMGWVLFQLGDAQAALGYLLQAIAKSETPDATVYDHLGDVYAALKQMDQAREAWAKSVTIEPSEVVQKKLDALKER